MVLAIASNEGSMFTTQLALFDGLITGLREIHSLGSILLVRAAPFAALDRMKPFGGFITYIIDFPRVYTGHGRDTRNIGERIDREARQSNGPSLSDLFAGQALR
jgi:hypothetical protein